MNATKPASADLALHALMQNGEIVEVGHGRYLVAPLNDELIETLIVASALTEDEEPDGNDDESNGDMEPSIGPKLDLESDGDCDTEANGDERDYDRPEAWTP
jgi:hypothetical protein